MKSKIDDNAKHFKRATAFKIYLINPSMRAALFGKIHDNDPTIGAIVETAIYSQWLHNLAIDNLHYARWKQGEVDLVILNNRQKPDGIAEFKWSDRCVKAIDEISSVLEFARKYALHPIITTKSISLEKAINKVHTIFLPSSLYCYTIAKNNVLSSPMTIKPYATQ